MTFARASMLNALAVAVRMVSGLAITKLIAVVVGPAGFALVGQFQNIVAVVSTLATGGTLQGITKFTAEYRGRRAARARLWRTAATIAAGCWLLLLPLTLALAVPMARTLLGAPELWHVFVLLALATPMVAANTMLLAVVNGLGDMRTLVVSGIAAALLGFVVTAMLTLVWQLPGALVGLAAAQAVGLPVTLFLVRRAGWLDRRLLPARLDRAMGRRLVGFMAMAATTALVTPLVQTGTRQWLASAFSLEHAGYWEAMMRLSATQLLFFTSALSAWYLPHLSQARPGPQLLASVHHVLVRVVPLVAVISLLLWLLRDAVVLLLFDRSFQPMTDLFAMQMVGDTLKIASWIYAFVLIGRGLTRTYIITEILFGFVYAGATIGAARTFGFQAASLGHAIGYFLYLAAMVAIVHRYCQAAGPAIEGEARPGGTLA